MVSNHLTSDLGVQVQLNKYETNIRHFDQESRYRILQLSYFRHIKNKYFFFGPITYR